MKFVLIPDRVSWISIFGGTLFQLVTLFIFIPPNSGGVAIEWLLFSNLAMIAGFTFLAVYENSNGHDKKAAIMTMLNATVVLWWTPLALAVWRLATYL